LGFVSVLDFFGVLSFPKTGEMGKTELRPFLTILGTRMRALTKMFNIMLVCLETSQEIPPRPEPYDVCFYVIKGQGTFTVGNKQTELKAGSMIFAPANVARGIKSTKRLSILGIQEAH
jgi:quercetin dioxygenase-like cupin family protein